MQNTFSQSGNDSKWFLTKIIFKIGMWHSRPVSTPPSLHGKCHLKFPFWFFAPLPNVHRDWDLCTSQRLLRFYCPIQFCEKRASQCSYVPRAGSLHHGREKNCVVMHLWAKRLQNNVNTESVFFVFTRPLLVLRLIEKHPASSWQK